MSIRTISLIEIENENLKLTNRILSSELAQRDEALTDLTAKLAEAEAVIRDAQMFIDGDESLQGLEMAIQDYIHREFNATFINK